MRRGNKARFLLNTLKKTLSWGSPLLLLIQFFGSGVGVVAYLSFRGRGVGWALIRGWALINFSCLKDGRLFEVGANSRLGAYSNKYGSSLLRLGLDFFGPFRRSTYMAEF